MDVHANYDAEDRRERRRVGPTADRWYRGAEVGHGAFAMIDAKRVKQNQVLKRVQKVIESIVRDDDLHAKRVLSLSHATLGVIQGAALGVTTVGRGTVRHRTHSLFFQGCHYYAAMPMMPDHDFRALTIRFGELLREQRITREVFGII